MKPRYLLTGLGIVAILVAGVLILKGQNVMQAPPERESGARSKGPAEAPIHITEFSDFQCPACRVAIPVVEQIFESFPGQILFEFHHYPLQAHSNAPLAHQAAECAASQRQFWPYHDRLYEEQMRWSHEPNPAQTLLLYARDMKLNLDAFAACLTDENVTRRIQADQKKGDQLKIQSTPTFFINGKRFVGGKELMEQGIPYIRQTLAQTQEHA